MKLPLFLALVLLLSIALTSAAALTSYNASGVDEHAYYSTGTGFVPTADTVTPVTRPLSNPRFFPLVNDLDGDGTSEIIALTSTSLNLYHGSTLDIVDSLSLPSGDWSPPVILDWDGDGFNEVILLEAATNNITAIEYNGTAIKKDQEFHIDYIREGTITSGANGFIGCRNDGICGAVSEQAGTSSWRAYGLTTFDSSGFIGQVAIQNLSSSPSNPYCSPFLRHVAIADYDGDTLEEFIFTGSNLGTLTIEYVHVDGSGQITSSNAVTRSVYQPGSTPTSCGTGSFATDGRHFTSPYVRDIDGSASNNMETVVAAQDDADEFRMYIYKADGTLLDSHPETAQAAGELVSNIFSADVFHDTEEGEDYCVAGFDSTTNKLDILCGSQITGEVPMTYEFVETLPYNISPTVSLWPHMSHSADQSSTTHTKSAALVGAGFGTINPTEFLTTFGILTPDYSATLCTGALGVHLCDISSLYEPPFVNASFIAADPEQLSRNDLLALTATNLWYLDDDYTKTGCGTSGCFTGSGVFNPCVQTESALTNTTVEFTGTLTDSDGDDVGMRMQLYVGTVQEVDSGWSNNFSSGTSISRSVIANTTASGTTLRISARDTFDPSDVETVDFSVNVNPSGKAYGQCTDTFTFVPVGEDDPTAVGGGNQTDAISTTVDAGAGLLGTSDRTLVWLFIFAVTWIAFPVVAHLQKGSFKLGATIGGVAVILEVLVAARLQHISAAWLVVLVVLGLAVTALFFWRHIAAAQSGG